MAPRPSAAASTAKPPPARCYRAYHVCNVCSGDVKYVTIARAMLPRLQAALVTTRRETLHTLHTLQILWTLQMLHTLNMRYRRYNAE